MVKQANPTEGETPEDGVIDIGLDATDGRAWYIVQTYSGYENKVKLICSANAPPERLYVDGEGAFEFERLVSRLMEMQSVEYLALAHGRVE